jgi:pimeloyl-ACP methyl ester carboxylesterase
VLTSLCSGRVFAERVGDRPAEILALHGWGRTRADLLPVVAGTSALVADLPGFGASEPPPEAWGTAEYAELLAPVLDDNDSWVLLGHSFGGRVAVRLAALRPERVGAVVLTGVPLVRRPPSGRPALRFRAAKTLHSKGLVKDVQMERLRQRYGSIDYRNATGVMRGTLVSTVNEDYAEVLPRVTAPVIMVWGARDSAAPLETARQAADLLPSAELWVSESSGHLLDDALRSLLTDAVNTALGAGASGRVVDG